MFPDGTCAIVPKLKMMGVRSLVEDDSLSTSARRGGLLRTRGSDGAVAKSPQGSQAPSYWHSARLARTCLGQRECKWRNAVQIFTNHRHFTSLLLLQQHDINTSSVIVPPGLLKQIASKSSMVLAFGLLICTELSPVRRSTSG